MPPPSCKLDLSIAIFMPERNDCAQSRLRPYKTLQEKPTLSSGRLFFFLGIGGKSFYILAKRKGPRGIRYPRQASGLVRRINGFSATEEGSPLAADSPRAPFFIKNHLADEIRRHSGFRLRLQDPLRPAGSYTVKQPGHIPP